MIDLDSFAAEVGADGPVTVTGAGSRGGPVDGVRCVRAPAGIDWVQPDEMTVCCGAGTPVDELVDALAAHGQTVALPAGGTVGGALAVGQSGIRRLGHGPVRDVLLQARYVGAAGEVVKAGGPTVKNVSGFDLCRLLVGSRGTLGFLGEVILRTRPLPVASQWGTAACADPSPITAVLYRPVSVLWDGAFVWALLEGHPDDIASQFLAAGLSPCDGPPALPSGSRRSLPPAEIASVRGAFVAEIGVGIVHHAEPWTAPQRPARVVELAAAVKRELDPSGRLNPGVAV
ncbi:MAG: FAD-binding protein [Ilumatobacteraceae bacterium]